MKETRPPITPEERDHWRDSILKRRHKPNSAQPERCPSMDPYDSGLQCSRKIHEDDRCRFGGIGWIKDEPQHQSKEEQIILRILDGLDATEAALKDKADEFVRMEDAWRRMCNALKSMSLYEIVDRQKQWSRETFGPGKRTKGLLDHIRSELLEIEEAPNDVEEWIDVVILALDGAWRTGAGPDLITQTLDKKYEKNLKRNWPDWRTLDEDTAIEHVK